MNRSFTEQLLDCWNTLFAARIGGDEFACLLPRYGELEMAALKEELRMAIKMNNQFYQGPRLTLAMGSAVCDKAGELERALRLADDAMYAAKRAFYASQTMNRRIL